MPYLPLEEIREVHLEMTNLCNAACPQCARNILGGTTDPFLSPSELSEQDIINVFTPDLCKQLELVMICGTHGDPIVARATLPAVRHLKAFGVRAVWINTNGSAQSKLWWQEMGRLLQHPEDRMVFSVDGLEDTNHIYRRGTSWQKIKQNMETFLAAGGRARWDFLVFKHNEHQVEMAQELAKQMGFVDFRIRKTSRFSSPFNGKTNLKTPVLRKLDKSFAQKFLEHRIDSKDIPPELIEYWLEPPQRPKYQNQDVTVRLKQILETHPSFENYIRTTKINCIYKNRFKRIYISAQAKLWPCCYLAGDSVGGRKTKYHLDILKNVIHRYGDRFNSLREHSLKDILEHPWLKENLVKSFDNTPDNKTNPRLLKCGRTCGEGFNPILSQTHKVLFSNEAPREHA